ncbi:MAG TPA: hypothetical protein VFS60_01225 [Thermoanaerobaculia bacterium]|nr:hypothetical protein [Thermoanaerobaculia bacterium]
MSREPGDVIARPRSGRGDLDVEIASSLALLALTRVARSDLLVSFIIIILMPESASD